MKYIYLLFNLIFILFFFGCNSGGNVEVKDTSELHQATRDEVEKLVEQFILAEDGTTIEMPAGFYQLETQLILDNKNNIKIKGKGMDKTILSFKGLKTGGEGMKIVGKNISLEDFSVYDAPGDGVKTQHCENILMRRVNATWTNGDKSQNGTYALYPVQCKNVIIDACEASHSRDAGIYVGQSENIIVKNCTAFGNVAGIEIENCSNVEVFKNKAYDNTGGILVFNLPGLPVADGRGTKIYDNEIIENNHKNFALIEGNNGNAVTQIPPGSGVVVMAGKDVEIFNNKILKNKTSGISIASYQVTGFPMKDQDLEKWSPFSSGIYIHDNEYERSSSLPDMSKDLGKLIAAKNAHGIGKTQDIVYDGIWDQQISKDISSNPMNICIKENMENLRFTRFYLMEGEDNIKSYKEYDPFVCDLKIETDISVLQ